MTIAEEIIKISGSLDSTHVPEPFTVDIKTEEDRKFLAMMVLHGYAIPMS